MSTQDYLYHQHTANRDGQEGREGLNSTRGNFTHIETYHTLLLDRQTRMKAIGGTGWVSNCNSGNRIGRTGGRIR